MFRNAMISTATRMALVAALALTGCANPTFLAQTGTQAGALGATIPVSLQIDTGDLPETTGYRTQTMWTRETLENRNLSVLLSVRRDGEEVALTELPVGSDGIAQTHIELERGTYQFVAKGYPAANPSWDDEGNSSYGETREIDIAAQPAVQLNMFQHVEVGPAGVDGITTLQENADRYQFHAEAGHTYRIEVATTGSNTDALLFHGGTLSDDNSFARQDRDHAGSGTGEEIEVTPGEGWFNFYVRPFGSRAQVDYNLRVIDLSAVIDVGVTIR